MVFNSLTFLVFLALFVPCFALTRGRWRLGLCLAASYLFYGWWDWRFLGLIALSTGVDYAIALRLDQVDDPRHRRRLVALSVVLNLGILAVFKYLGFFVASAAEALAALGVPASRPALEIILPVGISFYTFQTLSYTIDVYRRQLEPERSLLVFATFVAFFPQLVAGPIVRAATLLPQFHHDPPADVDRITEGAGQMLWGFFKKIVVADTLALYVDLCFARPEEHGSASLALGVVFYAFQIYGDFSGYSDIAIGLGKVLGYDLGANFDRPYFSASFSELWSRWHISLSSWLRDYLYVPLGGNRRGRWATHRNLMLTMLLGGLWHGASYNFVVWGGLHGLYLVLQRAVGPALGRLARTARLPGALVRVVSIALVFSATCLAWVFFRAQTLPEALTVLGRIAAFDTTGLQHRLLAVQGGAWVLALVAVEAASFRWPVARMVLERPVARLCAGAALLWSIALLGSFTGTRFIYFQF